MFIIYLFNTKKKKNFKYNLFMHSFSWSQRSQSGNFMFKPFWLFKPNRVFYGKHWSINKAKFLIILLFPNNKWVLIEKSLPWRSRIQCVNQLSLPIKLLEVIRRQYFAGSKFSLDFFTTIQTFTFRMI